MDRETKRLIEEYRRNEAGPLENNVIDELIGGELDREDFLRRATMFGLGAGTIGALLRFMGSPISRSEHHSKQARQAAHPGRHPRVRRLARAVPAQRGALARVLGHPGRVSDVHDPKGTVAPALATSWKPNAEATVDVPDPGRQVPQRQDADREDVASLKQYVTAKGSNAASLRSSTRRASRRAVSTRS